MPRCFGAVQTKHSTPWSSLWDQHTHLVGLSCTQQCLAGLGSARLGSAQLHSPPCSPRKRNKMALLLLCIHLFYSLKPHLQQCPHGSRLHPPLGNCKKTRTMLKAVVCVLTIGMYFIINTHQNIARYLQVFKAKLDGTLSNLVYLKVSLLMAESLRSLSTGS